MKANFLNSYFVLISIISGIFAPFISGQESTKTDESQPKGLQFSIHEGSAKPKTEDVQNPFAVERLSDEEANAILRRLPPMPAATEAKSDFQVRPGSLPPPKTGRTIPVSFPADNSKPSSVAPLKDLSVLRFSPSGNVPHVSDLSITFSQPMIALSSQEDAIKNIPVELSPDVDGKWRWLGTQTLIFEAEKRFPMATKFEAKVKKGITSVVGGTLKEEVSWAFTTPPPRVSKFYPEPGKVRGDSLIFAEFDQEIDPQAVFQKITATADGKNIELRFATEIEINGDKEISKRLNESLPKRGIVMRAAEKFPAGAKVLVSFDAGIPSAEGDLKTEESKEFAFEVFGKLEIDDSYCGWNNNSQTCKGYQNFTINFNNPLDHSSFDKSLIKIQPEIENARISVSGSSIEIYGYRKPRTKYRVTIPANLKDEFGQELGKDVSVTFRIDAEDPEIFGEGGDFITLDPSGKAEYSITSVNIKRFKASLYGVTPEDFKTFSDYRESEGSAKIPQFGKLVFDKDIKVKAGKDDYAYTDFDLRPALFGGFGHVVLVIEPADKTVEPIVKWLQKTNLGINAISDFERLSVFTSDLRDGKPLGNVHINLPGTRSESTNEKGIGEIELPAKNNFVGDWLIAQQGNDSAILRESEYQQSNDNWIRYADKDSLRWFVFDDRKMYRPGETVSIKGYIRKVSGGRFTDLTELGDSLISLFYILRDSRGNEIAKGSPEINAFGAFNFRVELPENINLGYQTIEFVTDSNLRGSKETHRFQVQEFRRPEFEVTAKVASQAPFYVGESASVTASANYYSGGALKNAETNWNVFATPTSYSPPNRDEFNFGEYLPYWRSGSSDYDQRTTQKISGKTDAEGNHQIDLDFESVNPAKTFTVRAEANIQDVNRQAFGAAATLLVHPSELYVGLRTPKTFIRQNEKLRVETITTDVDGNAIANARVAIVAELMDWEKVDGSWQQVVVDTQTCELLSGTEPVFCEVDVKSGGTFEVKANVWDKNERRNESEMTVWVAGGNSEISDSVEEEELELIPDKQEYAPGETAEILVNAPFFPAECVLTLERNGVVKTERFSMNGNSTILQIPVEEGFVPNVHIRVDIVGSAKRIIYEDERDKKVAKRPAFAAGGVNLNVSSESRKLAVSVEPIVKTLEPGGETSFSVNVKDFQGKTMAGTEVAILAVDESVLALTNYRIVNPVDSFYTAIASNTEHYNSRKNIILGLPDDLEIGKGTGSGIGMGSGSGGGTGNGSGRAPDQAFRRLEIIANLQSPPAKSSEPADQIRMRRNFDALAIFSPSVITDENGYAAVNVRLPDNLTRYRITAVAATKSKQFGLGESSITAKQSLQVRPSAPRFLNFGDTAELPVVIQNQTDSQITANVAIRARNAVLTDGNGRKVTIPANDRAEIRFPVTTESVGNAQFQVGAVSGNFADASEFQFPVYTPVTSEAFATYGTTSENGAFAQQFLAPKNVFSQFGGMEITTSSTQLQELTDAFIYLQSYPFECSEQISSRVISVAALRDVLTAFDTKDLPTKGEIEAKMTSDLDRLQKLQHKDGGFSFWRSNDESIPYLSVHVAHAIARAKQKGYKVSQDTITKSLSYLKNIETQFPKEYPLETRRAISAYALYVRDLFGQQDAEKAKILMSEATPEKLSLESLGWILSVIATDRASVSEIELIKRNLLNRVTETAGNAHFITDFEDGEYVLLNSERRVDAVVLEALLAVQENAINDLNESEIGDLIPKIVRGLLTSRTKGRWRNTQENAFVLLAIDKYFRTYEKETPDFRAKIWVGNGFAGEQIFKGRSVDSQLLSVPMEHLQKQTSAQNIVLDKQGAGRLYYRIAMNYAPKDLKLAAADYGFVVSRTYEAIDDRDDVIQNVNGSWTIKSGARIRVRIQMIAPTRRYHVALVDNLPAGIEIINRGLAVSGSSDVFETPEMRKLSFWMQHQNLRDNRAEAFTTNLSAGAWNYSYIARATTPGEFIVPPAKAEEMYSPETFGRSNTDFVTVK